MVPAIRSKYWAHGGKAVLDVTALPEAEVRLHAATTGRFDGRNRGGRGVCSQLSALGALDGCSGSFLCITEYTDTDLVATTLRGPKHASIVMTTRTPSNIIRA